MGGITSAIGGFVGDVLGIDSGAANAPVNSYRPTSFTSDGLSADISKNNISLERSPLLNQTLNSLGSTFNRQFQELGSIRGQLAPGFGALTQAAVSNLENRRRSAIGNLRENLQRRRVLGSSFASDALARTEAEFAQKESEIRSQARLQEIEANVNLINQQAQAQAAQFSTFLSQFNLEAQLAAQMSSGVSSIMAANAQAQASNIASAQGAQAGAIGSLAGLGLGLMLI